MAQPQTASAEDGILTDGDMGFTGVNELTQPSQLDSGEVAEASNSRFTNNRCEPRLGMAKLPWTNKVTSTSATPLPFATIYGSADFRDPAGVEWTVIAADGKVYRTRENNGATEVALPPGEVINYPVTFTQCEGGLLMFRGADHAELILNNVDDGFQMLEQTANVIAGTGTENPLDGTEAIPNAANGEWIGNRMFIPYNKDWLAISDYMNPTRYAGVRAQARINQGSEDSLVRFFKFNDNAGIAFKSASVYVLNNVVGDLSTMTLDELTREYGLAAAKSCVNTGADVWFLAEKRGICSIFQTSQNKFQGRDVPVSLRIKKLVDRINWGYASGAVAAYYDNKYYLAVPLDGAKALGAEILSTAFVYPSSPVIGVVAGQTYRYVKGVAETYLQNGPDQLRESGEFVAKDVVVTLVGTAGAAGTASLKRVRSGVNNAVLVYDFLQQKWAGVDTGAAMSVQEWTTASYSGVRRLLAIGTDGWINLCEELFYDEVGLESFGPNLVPHNAHYSDSIYGVDVIPGQTYNYKFGVREVRMVNGMESITAPAGTFVAQTTTALFVGTGVQFTISATVQLISFSVGIEWIDHDVTYRGYTCQSLARKRFVRAMLQVETWYPKFSVYAITEGASEEILVVDDKTKNFLVYDRPWDKPNWDPTNVNDDHATRYRQDYAVVLGEETTASGNIAAGVTYFVEDLTGAASIDYNGNVITAPATFVGVTGVVTYAVVSGTPKVYGPGNYFIPGSNGANPDQAQETTERLRLPLACRGRQVQLRVRTTRGRVSVLASEVEGRIIDQRMGSHV